MGIGIGIVLIVLGAILLFALNVDIPFFTDDTLGIILIVAGVLALVLALVMQAQRGRTKHVQENRYDGPRRPPDPSGGNTGATPASVGREQETISRGHRPSVREGALRPAGCCNRLSRHHRADKGRGDGDALRPESPAIDRRGHRHADAW